MEGIREGGIFGKKSFLILLDAGSKGRVGDWCYLKLVGSNYN